MLGQVWEDCRGRCPGSTGVKVEADLAAGVVAELAAGVVGGGNIQPHLPGCKPNCKVSPNMYIWIKEGLTVF